MCVCVCLRKSDFFVTIPAQNTCVCGHKPALYYSKVSVSVLERFMKPGMGIIDNFLLQTHHLLQSKSTFWGKATNFVAVLAQSICVYGFRLILYPLNFKISSWERFMKIGRGIKDSFLVHLYHIIPRRTHISEKKWYYWGSWQNCFPGAQHKDEGSFLLPEPLIWTPRRHPWGSRLQLHAHHAMHYVFHTTHAH